jgi:Uma2 family endonuclease
MAAIITPTERTRRTPDEGVRPRRWTRKEFCRAAELGLFRPEERLELLDGEIFEKMSPRPPHSVAVGTAGDVLAHAFGAGTHVRTEQPLVLNDESEPAPDIVVVPGKRSDYLRNHPTAGDALLVVEVADTSIRFDRGRKREAYARAGIREYWIVHLPRRQLVAHRDPSGSRYRSITIYREEEAITLLAAPHAPMRVGDLLPPASAVESV